MKRHEDLISQSNISSITEARRMRQELRVWREASREKVDQLTKEHAAKQYQDIAAWLKADESDQAALYDSIYIEGAKYPGTCEWLLENRRISSWLKPRPETPVIWLQGNAGSGKSTLSAQLVNFMRSVEMHVLVHFFDNAYTSSMIYEHILRSMLLQLIQKDNDLVSYVYGTFCAEKKAPKIQALERLLVDLSIGISMARNQPEYIWLLVDGLEACTVETQSKLVSILNRLRLRCSGPTGTVLKILVSSRGSSQPIRRLRSHQVVSLTDEKESLASSIRLYALKRLERLHGRFAQIGFGTDQVKMVAGDIAKKADGKYQSSRLQAFANN